VLQLRVQFYVKCQRSVGRRRSCFGPALRYSRPSLGEAAVGPDDHIDARQTRRFFLVFHLGLS